MALLPHFPPAALATDAELAAHEADQLAVHGITNTDELLELAAGAIATSAIPGFNTNLQNITGRPLLVNARVGIIPAPNQNGHIYLETTALSPVSWQILDYLACRNEALNTDDIGVGRGLVGVIPVGWFFRLRTQDITGTPAYVTDGAASITYVTL